MKLSQFLEELGECPSDQLDYTVIIERDNMDREPFLKIVGVRFEHAEQQVVIEASSERPL